MLVKLLPGLLASITLAKQRKAEDLVNILEQAINEKYDTNVTLPVDSISSILRPGNFWEKTVSTDQILDTTYGPVRGVLKQYKWSYNFIEFNDDPIIETFYQIPYAKAERWERPQNYDAWGPEKIYDATEYKENLHCYFGAPAGFDLIWRGNENDCLRLTLHRPGRPKTSDPMKRPLLIWIHGGSYNWGAGHGQAWVNGNHHFYDGSVVTHVADIVWAAINYRMNALGGLDTMDMKNNYDGNENVKGNFYFWDVIKAIDFLIDNAENIGFNKNQITVMGHSAGGSITSWLGGLDPLQGKVKGTVGILILAKTSKPAI